MNLDTVLQFFYRCRIILCRRYIDCLIGYHKYGRFQFVVCVLNDRVCQAVFAVRKHNLHSARHDICIIKLVSFAVCDDKGNCRIIDQIFFQFGCRRVLRKRGNLQCRCIDSVYI